MNHLNNNTNGYILEESETVTKVDLAQTRISQIKCSEHFQIFQLKFVSFPSER